MDNTNNSRIIEDSIKLHFERNGTLDEMRSGLHVKLLKLVRGEADLKKDKVLCGVDMKQRGLLQLLNCLIVDYFAWYGYKHTIETFSLETGDTFYTKPREQLRRDFGDQFEGKDLPILLQMVMKQVKKGRKGLPEMSKQENQNRKVNNIKTVIKDIPPEGKPNNAKVLLAPVSMTKSMLKSLPKSLPKSAPTSAPKSTPKLALPATSPECPQTPSINAHAKIKVVQSMAGALALQKKGVVPRMGTKPCTKLDESSAGSCADYDSDEPNTSSDSDEFADIPNRYYYREQEPPEQAYPDGAGEEGPCNTPSGSVRQSKSKQETTSKCVSRQGLRLPPGMYDEMPQCSRQSNVYMPGTQRHNSEQSSLYHLAVRRPTLINYMQYNLSKDSDEYL